MKPIFEKIKQLSSNLSVVVASVVLGVAFGFWFPKQAVSTVIISDIYVELLKLIAIPFMISSVIYSLSLLINRKESRGMLGRVVMLLMGSMIACALLGIMMALLFSPGSNLSQQTMLTLEKMTGKEQAGIEMALFSVLTDNSALNPDEMLLSLIPSNIFSTLAKGETLKILIFSMIFGVVIGFMNTEASKPLQKGLNSIFNACLKLTIWLNQLVPIVLIAVIAHLVATGGVAPLQAMIGFILCLGVSGLVVVLVSLFVLRLWSGLSWAKVLESQREPLVMAIATRNGPACMPVMLNTMIGRFGFEKERMELMIPLGISLLRVSAVLYYSIAAMFIAQMYGTDLQVVEWLAIAFGAVLAGFASSNMSGILLISLTGIVCSYVGLPFASLMVLFVAIDPITETIMTIISVISTNAFSVMACKPQFPVDI